jgi:hypothetical protein
MNPYALPPIVAFALLLVLSLAVIFQNARDVNNRLLFALCLGMALANGSSGMLHLSSNEAQAIFWNKWPYFFGVASFIVELEYILQISGRQNRLKETFIRVPIGLHRWVIYAGIFFTLAVLIFTDLLIAPPEYFSPTGWEHGYGPLFIPYIGFNLYLMVCSLLVLYRGVASTSDPIKKEFGKLPLRRFWGLTFMGSLSAYFCRLPVYRSTVSTLSGRFICVF